MKLVDLALFGQLQKMGFVMRIEINRYRFVGSVCCNETYVPGGISTLLSFIIGASQTNRDSLISANNMDLGFLRLLPCNIVKEFDGFARLLFNIKAKGLACDPKI